MPERKLEYSRLERKGQAGIVVKAPSLERLYIDAGLCLSDFGVKIEMVDIGEKRQATVTGSSRIDLMAGWLSEILRLRQVEKFLCRRIIFEKFDGKTLQAMLQGEKHNPIRHGTFELFQTIAPSHVAIVDDEGFTLTVMLPDHL